MDNSNGTDCTKSMNHPKVSIYDTGIETHVTTNAGNWSLYGDESFDNLHINKRDYCKYEGYCEEDLIGNSKCPYCKYFKPVDIPKFIERKQMADKIKEKI